MKSREGTIMTTATPQITIYRTSWCAFCHTEAQWLERLGIPFIEKDIEADPEANAELMKKINNDFRGVPVTDVAGDIILGFDRPKLQDAIKAHNIQPATA
ncbi:MAG: glutaredoxin domain-containing protein [Candidatus Microsaccharimonas sp.]